MKVDKELKKLARAMHIEKFILYIVGGYTRDTLIGLKSSDIDLASNMPYDQIMELSKSLGYKSKVINKTLGTVLITTGEKNYEYTQFRSESYSDGKHSPSSVDFIDDINIDSLRRDITINAIYYDIYNEKIIDPLNGEQDIKNKIIRTCNSPEKTLKDDGLRILRLIRFSSLLNFKIEKNTLKSLKQFSGNLKTISKERILNELKLICVADLKNSCSNSLALGYINKFKLLPLIFNSTIKNIKKFNKQDINAFYNLSKDSRLIGLYILVLTKYLRVYYSHKQIHHIISVLLGVDGIKESRDNIYIVEKLFCIYQNLKFGIDLLNASINYLTLSDSEKEIIDNYLPKKSKTALSDTITLVKAKNLPLSVHKLDICAQDLIGIGIEERYISKLLEILYNKVLEMKVKNQKDDLINLARELNNIGLSFIQK